jgi:CheY-like chemotaxis protein
MGIPVEEQEVIFDEFRRSERSVARGYGGMGLGLAITRRLIELHGGRIGVRSAGQEEVGSTFHFSLPVMVSAPAGVQINRSRRNTVLLLSENPSTLLREHLQQKGFDVEVLDVTQQPDWLRSVISQPPGAVVLDFQPATERGWELMQLMKQNPETRDVPVVFYNLSTEMSQGSMLEMDYLSKPVASTELFHALERLGLKSENSRAILVVDDDPNVLDMHVRMLENRLNCRILKAYGGKQALEIMGQESPALVLLDLMMPEIDGFEVLRVMRAQEGTRTIPVIVLSAQILTAHDMLRLQEGVAAVLGKGLFGVEEVLAQVEAALNHSKRLGSQASRVVRQAMAYIHERYDEPISRADLARHVAITERYLTHCFHQEMGITPMTYLNRYRVKRAKTLLEQGKLSITEVAMAVGFSDGSYFNRVFRQEAGLAPGAYQRGVRTGSIP